MKRLNIIKYVSTIIIVLLLLIWWLYTYNYFESFRIRRRKISTPKAPKSISKATTKAMAKTTTRATSSVVNNTEKVATTAIKAVENIIPVIDLTALVNSASRFVQSIKNISNAF